MGAYHSSIVTFEELIQREVHCHPGHLMVKDVKGFLNAQTMQVGYGRTDGGILTDFCWLQRLTEKILCCNKWHSGSLGNLLGD